VTLFIYNTRVPRGERAIARRAREGSRSHRSSFKRISSAFGPACHVSNFHSSSHSFASSIDLDPIDNLISSTGVIIVVEIQRSIESSNDDDYLALYFFIAAS